MNNYKSLYENIQNPLDNEDNLNKLLDVYSEREGIRYYDIIKLQMADKDYKQGQYSPEIRDEFYAQLFRIWKNNILSWPDYMLENNADYIKLKEQLKNLPEVKTEQQYRDLLFRDDLLIKDYTWENRGSLSGWNHIHGRDLSFYKYKPFNVEHRLYLNTESIDTELLASLFVDKCERKNIPFYFKYDEDGYRDDTLVIYSDTENLQTYLDILNDIKKENKELIARCHKPPVLTGIIDGWIGYGSEPILLPNGQNTSFNSVRSKVISKGIKKGSSKWIYDHRNDYITYQNKRVTVKECLISKIVDNIYDDCSRYFTWNKNNLSYLYNHYGLTPNDFKNDQLKNYITNYLNTNLNIDKIIYNEYLEKNMNDIEMPTRNNQTIDITSDIRSGFYKIVGEIKEKDFKNQIKNSIIEEGKKEGIDPNKFCFDIDKKELLFNYQEKEVKKVNNEEIDPKTYASQRVESFKNLLNKSTNLYKFDDPLTDRELDLNNGEISFIDGVMYTASYKDKKKFTTNDNQLQGIFAQSKLVLENIVCNLSEENQDKLQRYYGLKYRDELKTTISNDFYSKLISKMDKELDKTYQKGKVSDLESLYQSTLSSVKKSSPTPKTKTKEVKQVNNEEIDPKTYASQRAENFKNLLNKSTDLYKFDDPLTDRELDLNNGEISFIDGVMYTASYKDKKKITTDDEQLQDIFAQAKVTLEDNVCNLSKKNQDKLQCYYGLKYRDELKTTVSNDFYNKLISKMNKELDKNYELGKIANLESLYQSTLSSGNNTKQDQNIKLKIKEKEEK